MSEPSDSMTVMPSVGAVVAGYRLEALLGGGGTGLLYRARHQLHDRPAAVKLIRPELAAIDSFRERFRVASRAAAALEHPSVLPIFDAGEDLGFLYIAMRLVCGTTLDREIAEHGSLEPRRAVRIVSQIASALDAAHAAGLIHGEVKPANVLLEADHPYLTDFGLRRRAANSDGLTGTGQIVGSVDFVAPEQIRGERVDSRVDIYALGALAFHALTGQAPFARENDLATMREHIHAPPPRVTDRVAGLATAVDAVIAQALAKDVDARPASAAQFAAALAEALAGPSHDDAGAPPSATTAAAPAGATSTTCGVCGQENPPGFRFCGTCGHDRQAVEPPVARGRVAGYRIDGMAGRGGMGIVYRAHDERLGRMVAVKVIAPQFARDRGFRERFQRESRLAAQIEHPNVVPVYRAGEDAGRLYIAMRFVDGSDLATLLARQGRLAPQDAVGIVAQVAAALDAAHARGLVHRDVKPANVLLTGGDRTERAYLTDFGLSVEGGAQGAITRTGQWVGTLAYVAPEQIHGAPVDARTDVYALGGLLHHCLTGEVPFPRDGEPAALIAHLHDPRPRPTAIVPDLPPELDAVVARAMGKDPADRYPSAGDLGRAARAAAYGQRPPRPQGSVATGAAAPATDRRLLAPPPRPRRRAPAPALTAAIAAAATLVAVVAFVLAGGGEPGRSTAPANPAGRLSARVIAVPQPPDRLALLGGDVWALTQAGGGLARVDARHPTVRRFPAAVDLGGGSYPALAAGFGSLWIAHDLPTLGGIDRVNAADGRAIAHLTLPHAVAVAVGSDAVWAASVRRSRGRPPSGRLVAVDPRTNRRAGAAVDVGRDPVDVAVGAGAVWVADRRGDEVLRVDPRTRRVTARVGVGDGPGALAVGRGAVWVANLGDRTLTRIDPAANQAQGAPITLGKEIDAVALSERALWVAGADGTVTRLRPADGSVVGTPIAVGHAPLTLAADPRGVWVASAGDFRLRRIEAA